MKIISLICITGVEINQATPLRCQRCSRKGCHLVQNCSETAEYRCIGVPTTTQNTQSIEISKTIRNHSTTSVSKTKPIYTKNTPSSISKKRTSLKKITLAKPTLQTKVTIQTEASDAEKEPNIYILIPISVILPILLMVTLVMIIILRRRKCGEEDIVQIKELQQDDTNQYAQVDKTRNKENFTFEPQSKNPENLEVTKELRPNTLDIDKEDGVYDHLGESEFRGIIKEDTYDHASFVVVRGDCDYDNTQSIKRQEEESTYDHSMVIRSDG
ncbi:uncharacterized protein LOC133194653 [Saccostrea echinata]|uniref:uncharacterized protein LOC133194653 n=1 Tax=Saccostrea echinata TaxID=191078 RepID=UPI002A80D4DA|nr:uncharacterized protein LOC133194653 [Saccostrea echinata]